MITYAINDTPLLQFDTVIVCEDSPLTTSWADIHITEIWFDWNDERVEVTNIWNQDFSGTLSLSWVKSVTLSYNIELPSKASIIFWDSLTFLTWNINIVTWQWFSLPDTTWFTVSLIINSVLTQQQYFSKNTILQIPNTFWLEAIRSGTEFFWKQTSLLTNFNTISPTIANPWILFCSPDTYNDIFPIEDTWLNEPPNTSWSELSWENVFTWIDTIIDSWALNTGFVPEDTGYLPPIEYTWIDTIEDISPPQYIPQQLPCTISEIHSTSDTYPEYVELLCSWPFFGTIKTMGIGVWETNKDILINTNGWYWIISSSTTWLLSLFNSSVITSISLRDSWETIIISSSGFTTWEITFPEIPSWKSFYPLCWTSGCIWLSSPWFSELYLSGFIIWPVVSPPSPVISSNTTISSTSTYYQDLYNKRKSTAESYKSENSTLKKEQTRINKELTTLQKKAQTVTNIKKSESKTTTKDSTIKVTTPKSTTPKITSKPKTKPKTKAGPKAKTSVKTSTPKKTPTVSTTSKAYIKLTDEHKLYKNYVTFVDSYLKSHLYTQYSSLGIAKIQSLLAKSLKEINKQNYILYLSWSTTWISVFDFDRQLWQNIPILDTLYISLFRHYSSFFSSFSNSISGIFLAKDISKDTLIEWKTLSKNDTWNDIMGTKISEMSYLHLE